MSHHVIMNHHDTLSPPHVIMSLPVMQSRHHAIMSHPHHLGTLTKDMRTENLQLCYHI